MELSVEKGKEKQKNINPLAPPSAVVFHSYKQKKDHALESLQYRKEKIIFGSERGAARAWGVGGDEYSWQRNRTNATQKEREKGASEKKE